MSVVQLGRHTHVPSAAPSSNLPLSSSLALREVVWSRSGILYANFTVENMGNVAVRDFIVTCVDYGASGTPIDSAAITRYDVLEAKTARESNIKGRESL